MMNKLKKIFKHKHKWEVRRTIIPYNYGWGTYCPGCRTVLDTGLTKKHAQRSCDELNRRKSD